MTPIAGFIIAAVAGWMVWDGRRAAGTVLVPWFGVLAVQTWLLASGRGVSPPSTVTKFPDLIGYWAVQAVFLAFPLGIASQLGALQARRHRGSEGITRAGRQAAVTSAILIAASAVLAGVAVSASSPRLHHSATGSPPWFGVVGMALCIVAFAALSMVTIRNRRAAARRAADPKLEKAVSRTP
jgi:hypothetical protein